MIDNKVRRLPVMDDKRLRSQVIELQSRIRQLEAELTAQHASQKLRLTRYREVYYEATWIELDIQE